MVKLSLVIPTYNRLSNIKELLNSILGYVGDFEIIIIDGGSTDGTKKYIDELAKSNECIKIIHELKREGAVSAFNKGFKKAEGKYVFICNDDFVLDMNVLFNCCLFMEDNPAVGIVSPKMIESKYNNYPNVDFHSSGLILGKAHVFRMKALEDVGFFDNFFKTYYIELDVYLMILNSGWHTCFTKRVGVVHNRSHLNRDGVKSMDEDLYFYDKWKDLPKKDFRLLPRLLLKCMHFRPLQYFMRKQCGFFVSFYDYVLNHCSRFVVNINNSKFYLYEKIN